MAVSTFSELLTPPQSFLESRPGSMRSSAKVSSTTLPIDGCEAHAPAAQRIVVAVPPGGREFGSSEYALRKSEAQQAVCLVRDTNAQQSDLLFPTRTPGSRTLYLPASFAGPDDSLSDRLECSLAAGPSHIVVATTAGWTVMNKAGDLLHSSPLAGWLAPFVVHGRDLHLFNSKVLYDQHTGKWFLLVCGWEKDSGSGVISSSFIVAASQTRNPVGKWWAWKLDAGLDGAEPTPYHAGSLAIGVDNAALYLSADMFDRDGAFRYAKVRVLEKTSLLTGEDLAWLDFRGMQNSDGSPAFGIQPTHTFGAPGVEYFVSAASSGSEINVWNLTAQAGGEPALQRRTVPTGQFNMAPNAVQLGSSKEIDTGDTSFVNAVFRNGSLWAAHTIAANWGNSENRAAIQWFQLNPGAGKVVQQRIYGAPGYDYFCPTLMADGKGNVTMVFNSVCRAEYPRVRFTGRLGIDTPNKLQPSVSLCEGAAAGPACWGSFNGAAVDPNDIKIWIAGKYPKAIGTGGTWIGETSFMLNQPEMKRR